MAESTPNNAENSTSAEGGSSPRYEEFVRLFAQNHRRLLGYILAFERDRAGADEVFQETSLILWREFGKFRPGAEFMPWAAGIAFNQLRKYWRQRRRNRRYLSEAVLDELAQDAAAMTDELDARQEALAECLQKLSEKDRRLIEAYYGTKSTAQDVAAQLGRSVHTIYKGLQRVRAALLACIDSRLATEGTPGVAP